MAASQGDPLRDLKAVPTHHGDAGAPVAQIHKAQGLLPPVRCQPEDGQLLGQKFPDPDARPGEHLLIRRHLLPGHGGGNHRQPALLLLLRRGRTGPAAPQVLVRTPLEDAGKLVGQTHLHLLRRHGGHGRQPAYCLTAGKDQRRRSHRQPELPPDLPEKWRDLLCPKDAAFIRQLLRQPHLLHPDMLPAEHRHLQAAASHIEPQPGPHHTPFPLPRAPVIPFFSGSMIYYSIYFGIWDLCVNFTSLRVKIAARRRTHPIRRLAPLWAFGGGHWPHVRTVYATGSPSRQSSSPSSPGADSRSLPRSFF